MHKHKRECTRGIKKKVIEHIITALMEQDQNTMGNLPGKQEILWHADYSPRAERASGKAQSNHDFRFSERCSAHTPTSQQYHCCQQQGIPPSFLFL